MTEREKLIDLLSPTSLDFEQAVEVVDYLIANGVKIPVRCDECKYNRGKEVFGKNFNLCERHGTIFNKNYFCQYGERKDNG